MKHAAQVSYDSRAATNGNASISACLVPSRKTKTGGFPPVFITTISRLAERAGVWFNYASAIAPTGHCPAQEPQSIHLSASITNCPSPIEIAPTGHCPSQDPQLMQESLIQYAIVNDLLI